MRKNKARKGCLTMEKKIWEQNIPCDAVLIRRLQKPAGQIDVVLDTDTLSLIHIFLLLLVRHDGKIRRDAEQVEEFPHDRRAEAVDRADLRLLEQKLLAAQPGVFGMLPDQLEKPALDALAHLGRRRLCEGHDEQPVRLRRRCV